MEPEFVFSGGAAGVNEQRAALSEKLLSTDNDNSIDFGDAATSRTLHHHQHHTLPESLIVDSGEQVLSNSGNGIVGEKQPNQYRDVWAVILFGVSQIILLYFSLFWGISALDSWMSNSKHDHSDTDHTDHAHNGGSSFIGIVWLVISCGLAAFFISGAALGILLRVAQQLIQICLMATVASSVVLTAFFISQRLWYATVGAMVFCAATAMYAWSVWRRIPFAAANLQVAITAIQANGGLVITAVGVTVAINWLWTILWGLAWIGIYDHSMKCSGAPDKESSGEHDSDCIGHMNVLSMMALVLIYMWTMEVGKQVMHVTTAGVVGTFWFAPDDAGTYCSPAVTDSLLRATTFSFGSICFGSLLTSIVQGFHAIVVALRQAQAGRGRSELLLCVLECITSFLDRLVTYFNQWSFVYIGLYGYDYLTAGKKVTELLLDRGWTAVINDNLVVRVLTLVSLMVGASTGVVGLLIVSVRPSWVAEWGSSGTALAFFLPAMIGIAMSHVMMSVVVSAVDTVVVAFAEAPLEFERNHPGLSSQLVAAWRLVYPEEYLR
jgi:hypothetical protein